MIDISIAGIAFYRSLCVFSPHAGSSKDLKAMKLTKMIILTSNIAARIEASSILGIHESNHEPPFIPIVFAQSYLPDFSIYLLRDPLTLG